MNVKKIFGFIISASVIASMLTAPVTVDAAERYAGDYQCLPTNWSTNWGTDSSKYQYENYYTRNTTWNREQDYFGINLSEGIGGSPAIVVNNESPLEDNRFMHLYNNLNTTLTVGEKYRVSFWVKGSQLSAKASLNGNSESWITAFTKGETTADGFTNYYKDYQLTKATNQFLINTSSKVNFVIDNLSVQKLDASGNPDGTELARNGNCSTYEYTFTSGTRRSYLSAHWAYLSGANDGDAYMQPYFPGKTGKWGLHIKYNNKTASDFTQWGQRNGITYAAGKDYTLEFSAKGDISNLKVHMGSGGANGNFAITDFEASKADGNGWITYTKNLKFENETTTKIIFYVGNIASLPNPINIIIDDVKVCSSDAPETNLVVGGGFEGSYLGAGYSPADFKTGADYIGKYTLVNPNEIYYGAGVKNDSALANATHYIEPVSYEAKDGNYSMHMRFQGTDGGNQYVRYIVNKTIPAGTYTISADIKGYIDGNHKMKIGITDNGTQVSASDLGPADDNGWRHYEKTVTRSAEANCYSFVSMQYVNVYIDNFSIKDAEGNEYAKDVGFENTVKVKDGYTEEIGHLMAYPAIDDNDPNTSTYNGGGLNISWYNPANDGITDIDVYVDGKVVKNCKHDLTSGAFNEMYVDGLTNYKEYPIKVVMTFKDGSSEAETIGVPDNKGRWGCTFCDWSVDRRDLDKTVNGLSFTRHSNYNLSLDSEVVETGAALRIDMNTPITARADDPTRGEIIPNLAPSISQTLTVNRNQMHTLKFRAKTENVGLFRGYVTYTFKDSEGVEHKVADKQFGIVHNENTPITTDTAWKEYSYIYTDADTVDALGTGIDLACTAHQDCGVNLYDVTAPDTDKCTVNIRIQTEYAAGTAWLDDIGFYVADSDYGDATGSNFIRNGSFDTEYTIYDAVFKNADGEVLENIEEGTITATAKVKNFIDQDGVDMFLIFALYNGNELVQLSTDDKSFEASSAIIPADEAGASLEVPALDTGDYKIKVMYWNGTDKITPIQECDILEEAVVIEEPAE